MKIKQVFLGMLLVVFLSQLKAYSKAGDKHFNFSAGYSFIDTLELSGVIKSTNSSLNGKTLEINLEGDGGAPAIAFEYQQQYSDHFGMIYGLDYNFKREFTKSELVIDGITATGTANTDLSWVDLYADFVWNFEVGKNHILYPLVGLKIFIPSLDANSSETEMSGGMGIKIGGGYEFKSHFIVQWAIEGYSSSVKLGDLGELDASMAGARIDFKYPLYL